MSVTDVVLEITTKEYVLHGFVIFIAMIGTGLTEYFYLLFVFSVAFSDKITKSWIKSASSRYTRSFFQKMDFHHRLARPVGSTGIST